MDYDKLCYGCFEIKHTDVCPYCGFDGRFYEHGPLTLPPGSVLTGRYLAGRALGQGGFGITYIGFDLTLEVKVAIKEFMPQGLVLRAGDHATVSLISKKDETTFISGVERFTDEARILAKLAHIPGIVKVSDYFQENATAYFVMEYVEGMSLKTFLQNQGGRIPCEQALTILRPLMEALAQVHEMSLLHRDISTDNIYITNKGQTKLLDFGAARYALGGEKSLSVILKHGYAPEEQYRSRGNQGPWTDVYALCATLYTCITGALPPDSIERLSSDNLKLPSALGVDIPPHVEKALTRALAVRADDRTQNMTELLRSLAGSGAYFAHGNTLAAPNASTILGGEGFSGATFFKKLLRNKAALAIGGGALALIVIALLIALPNKSVPAGGGGGGGVTVNNPPPPAVTPDARPRLSEAPEPDASPKPEETEKPGETEEPEPAPGGFANFYTSEDMNFSISLKRGWSIVETEQNGMRMAALAKNGAGQAAVMRVPDIGVEAFLADKDVFMRSVIQDAPHLKLSITSEEQTLISAYNATHLVFSASDGDELARIYQFYFIGGYDADGENELYMLGFWTPFDDVTDTSVLMDASAMFSTFTLLGENAPAPTPTSVLAPDDGMIPYVNEKLGFSLRYPIEMEEVVEYPNEEDSVYYLLKKDDGRNFICVHRAYSATLENLLAGDDAYLPDQYESVKLIEENEMFASPSGRYHARFYNVRLDGALYRLVRLILQLGEDAVIITMRGDLENVEQMELFTDAILPTIIYN